VKQFSRRSLFAALAGIPLAGGAVRMKSGPTDVPRVGHFVRCPDKLCGARWVRVETYDRQNMVANLSLFDFRAEPPRERGS
jgi:hypothetical protein